MSIVVQCSVCGTTQQVEDFAAGTNIACSVCGATIQIPEQIYDAIVDSFDEPLKPLDEVRSTEALAAPVEGERKPCPVCRKMIVATAAKCRFCHKIFDPRFGPSLMGKSKSGDPDDDLSTGDWILTVLCSTIGCIAGVVWMIRGKKKGIKMIVVSIAFVILWNILFGVVNFAFYEAN